MDEQTNCKVPGRNFCAPGGKRSALFVDIDGTIMKCDPYFQTAYKRFRYLMKSEGIDAAEAEKHVRSLYFQYMGVNGVERDQLSIAMSDAYKALCQKLNKQPVEEVTGMCGDIGNYPYFREPELFKNALRVLSRAKHNFLIIFVTMGNREAQKHKFREVGLEPDYHIITAFDNKAERVADMIEDARIDPEYSVLVGNSGKSDGACITETHVALVPFEKGVFDDNEPPKPGRFKLHNVRDWHEVEGRVLERLIIRRNLAVQAEDSARRRACTSCSCASS